MVIMWLRERRFEKKIQLAKVNNWEVENSALTILIFWFLPFCYYVYLYGKSYYKVDSKL